MWVIMIKMLHLELFMTYHMIKMHNKILDLEKANNISIKNKQSQKD